MKADIYIALPSNPDLPLRVVRVRNGELEDLPLPAFKAKAQTNAVAFAPASAIGTFRIPLPARSESEALKVALYAIEDDLAQPVEDIVLTLGPRDPVGPDRDIYVVDRQLMTAWRDQLRSLGLEHAPIIAESSLNPGKPAIFDFGDRLLLSTPELTQSLDAGLPDNAIQALITAAGLSATAVTRADALATCIDLHEQKSGVSLKDTGGNTSRQASIAGLRGWLLAGALAAAGLVLWISTVWLETHNLEQVARQHEATARTAFRQQFDGAPEPADVHSEVRRLSQIAAGRENTGFRPLSSALYEALAGSETIQLKRLTYASDDQVLRAELQFANRADEAAFRTRVETAGWQIETERAVDGPSGVDASIAMRARL